MTTFRLSPSDLDFLVGYLSLAYFAAFFHRLSDIRFFVRKVTGRLGSLGLLEIPTGRVACGEYGFRPCRPMGFHSKVFMPTSALIYNMQNDSDAWIVLEKIQAGLRGRTSENPKPC